MSGRGVNALGHGFEEILGNETLFEEYAESLMVGLDSDDAEAFKQLLENSRMNTLHENAMANISPVASLNGPMLRKFFPKLCIKDAFPTEVVQMPQFYLSYLLPYLVRTNEDGTTQEFELPEKFKDTFRC